MPIRSIFADVERAKGQIENLSVEALADELGGDPPPLVVDIRELQERVNLGTIPGAVHVPRGMLEFWADPQSRYYRDYFQEGRRTVLFCAGGGRSALAALALQEMGFPRVAHLELGFAGWQDAGRPVEDVSATSRWVQRESR
ncbi:MAG: rhodanese-like domain-containing protein [Pseudomonadales bacterium]